MASLAVFAGAAHAGALDFYGGHDYAAIYDDSLNWEQARDLAAAPFRPVANFS